MDLQEKALEFLTCFCNADIDGLNALLGEDFQFQGPLIEYSTKESYIASLQEDPPVDFQIEIAKTFENGEDVGVFYTFTKPGVETFMAQYFKFNEGKIVETILVFDTAAFSTN